MIGTGLRHTIGVSDPNKGGLPMPIYYSCRYCGDYLGKVDQPIEEERLGFHILSPSERDSVISREHNGDTHVHVVCEHCQEVIDRDPETILNPTIHH